MRGAMYENKTRNHSKYRCSLFDLIRNARVGAGLHRRLGRRSSQRSRRLLRAAGGERYVGGSFTVRTLLVSGGRPRILATVLFRLLGLERLRLVLAKRRTVGVGLLPLRPVGVGRPLRLAVGPR